MWKNGGCERNIAPNHRETIQPWACGIIKLQNTASGDSLNKGSHASHLALLHHPEVEVTVAAPPSTVEMLPAGVPVEY